MPLPDNFVAQTNEPSANKKTYDILPEGVYQVSVMDIDLIDDTNQQTGEEVQKLNFTFVVLTDEEFDGEANGTQNTRGRRLWKSTTLKMSPGGNYQPSNLYLLATAILRKDLSWDECKKFKPSTLIGQQLRVGVKHRKSSTGRVSARVDTFYKVNKMLPDYDPEVENPNPQFTQNITKEDVPF